jgi:hypothetical protein
MFKMTPEKLRRNAAQYRTRAEQLDRDGKFVQARTWRTKAERMESRAAQREGITTGSPRA